jgi:signal transduction histidine kinase
MVELSRILTATMELDRLLHNTLYQVVHSFERGCCSAIFLRRSNGRLELSGEYRRPNAPPPASPLLLEQVVTHAVSSEQPAGARLDGTVHLLTPESRQAGTTYRTLAVPLRAKGQTFGGLVLSSVRDEEPLGKAELSLLNAFGQQVATAIEDVRLYRVVQERETQLEALVRQLVNAQEGERQRVARELHDETGQKLTAMAMGLAAIEVQLGAGDLSAATGTVHDLREVADQAITELRNVMADLRPSQLDDLGLVPALRWYVQRYAARHPRLAVTFDAGRLSGRLGPRYETVLFRAAQEALTNVARHANATQVTVTLAQEDGCVHLEVADNGVGFDASKPPQHDEGSGWGLTGIRERAALVGGKVTVESQPGQGTRVRVEVPIR